MDGIIQQFALMEALLSNWDAIRMRMGLVSPALERTLAQIAGRLSEAQSPDEFALVTDDLLDATMDTAAYDFVRDLVARSNADPDSMAGVRGIVAPGIGQRPVIEKAAEIAVTEWTQKMGRTLGGAVTAKTTLFEVPVFFATNRRPKDRIVRAEDYSGELGSEVKYGQALVTIPVDEHKIGKLETPAWWNLLSDKGDQRRYVVLRALESLTKSEFYEKLARALQVGDSNDVVVFLHGYNVTFEEACRRAAQASYDLQFRGAVVLFSWPSLGHVRDYGADGDRAAASAAHLALFLQALEGGPWKKVHLVAHSMGNRVLIAGLADNRRLGLPLREIVLVAADLEGEIFKQKFAKIVYEGGRFTSYVSKVDRALLVSSRLHKTNRIGFLQEEPFIWDGLETIDATSVDTSLLGHNYYCEDRSVLMDLGYLLREGLPAERRGLQQVQGKAYWRFPR
jgi:esterase/lipase superfamily enzyme